MPEAVSVVVPAFRSHACIGRALRSVLAQTVPPAEVIVVDDASGPEALRLLEAELAALQWGAVALRLLKLEQNAGPATARNTGWNHARGRYVAFLDSDDAWHPQKLERQLAVMEQTGALMSCHAYAPDREMDASPTEVRWYRFRDFVVRNRCATPTVIVRRDVDLRFEDGRRHSEDYQLWLRLARRGPVPALAAELARGFKAAWGEAGLSSQMRAALLGQYKTYISLVTDKSVPIVFLPMLLAWSTLRYARRRVLLAARPLARGDQQ